MHHVSRDLLNSIHTYSEINQASDDAKPNGDETSARLQQVSNKDYTENVQCCIRSRKLSLMQTFTVLMQLG